LTFQVKIPSLPLQGLAKAFASGKKSAEGIELIFDKKLRKGMGSDNP